MMTVKAAQSRTDSVRDQRIERIVPLLSPQEIYDEVPLSETVVETLLGGRQQTRAILDGEDDRLIVVVGPCSVHDPVAVKEYAQRLAQAAQQHQDDLLIVMRVYFEKPRTTVGWKGLINDPHLDGSGDVNTGLRLAREVLVDVLELGLATGCEFLDPITPQYISDLVCWGAIGARTTESQIHRQLGSGLSMPVGYKNRTDGDVQVAVDAVRAAAVHHAFAGVDADGRSAILHTRGNSDCHIILRGGSTGPNFDAESIASAGEQLAKSKLPNRVMIDLSHANSNKDPDRQPAVAQAVGQQIADGDESIIGVMLESFLVSGKQSPAPLDELVYGQSITDGCIDWETTTEVLTNLAKDVRARRDKFSR